MALHQYVLVVCLLHTLTIASALISCSPPAAGTFSDCSTLATDNGFTDITFPPMDYLNDIGRIQGTNEHLACICEGSEETGKFLVVYDCDLRIPVYTLTKLTEVAAYNKSRRGPVCVKRSLLVACDDQASNEDYKDSQRRTPCYVQNASTATLLEEELWSTVVDDRIKANCCLPVHSFKIVQGFCLSKYVQCISPIDMGHLTAYEYLGSKGEITDVYTNIVPQFSRFNRGVWRTIAGKIVEFAKECYDQNSNGNVYVATGAVPSTYNANVFGTAYTQKWLGRHGFGDDTFVPEVSFNAVLIPDATNVPPFRINVPIALWTNPTCLGVGGSVESEEAHAALNLPESTDMSFADGATMFLQMFQ